MSGSPPFEGRTTADRGLLADDIFDRCGIWLTEDEARRVRAAMYAAIHDEVIAELAEALLALDPNATIGDADEHPADFIRHREVGP